MVDELGVLSKIRCAEDALRRAMDGLPTSLPIAETDDYSYAKVQLLKAVKYALEAHHLASGEKCDPDSPCIAVTPLL